MLVGFRVGSLGSLSVCFVLVSDVFDLTFDGLSVVGCEVRSSCH
jgi:hypothetical protein